MAISTAKGLPRLVIALVVAGCAWVDLDLKLWQLRDRVIEWDAHSYYAYLPAQLIYDDIRLIKSDYRFDEDYFLFWPSTAENGGRVIKTTMGVAVCYAPFFLLGHLYASLSAYPADGWSPPFKIALLIGALFYLAMGLELTRHLLARCGFRATTTAITLALIGSGTNLFCYASQSATSSHVYSFFLVAWSMNLVLSWYERPSFRRAAGLGALLGLVSLVRPTNVLLWCVFALYGIVGYKTFMSRLIFLFRRWAQLLVMAIAAFIVWVPQLMYWKTITGAYFYNSYIGEHFFFTSPHILEGMFGFRKGWLIYTPIMAFALAGLGLLRDRAASLRWGLIVLMVLSIYVTFSWWCWWYGGTFGQRAMIDLYPLLAIPLAAFVDRVLQGRLWVRIVATGAGSFLVWLNIFQTLQFEEGSLHYDAMTFRCYVKQFGRMEKVEDFEQLLDHPDYDRARQTGQ